MTAISINSLSFSFGVKPVLKDVSFSLEEGDKLGVIGVNGCGKSTLFSLILGEREPDEGSVYIARDKTVGILTQEGAFETSELAGTSALEQMYAAFPELIRAEDRLAQLTIDLERCDAYAEPERHRILLVEYTDLNNKFIRDGGLEFRSRCASILLKLGYDEQAMRADISTLSGGQRTRLALARQLCREPDILLLDEPTNHLDMETLSWLESFLLSYRKCVILISHDRYFLDRVTNKTLAIEHCRAKLYNGGYTATMEQRRIDREIAEKHYRDQQKEIARQEAYIAQQRAWNRERNIIAAESRQKMLDKMERLEKPQDAPRGIKIKFSETIASGNEVLRARGLAMGFGEKRLFSGVDFLIKKNERVFFVGPNGCGKSTLIRLILGKLIPTSGFVETGYNVEIGYYDQENQNLDENNTVLEELWSTYPTMNEVDIRSTLAAFRFLYEDTEKQVKVLSGGERARLTLAKLMLSKINVLVLDEPTNHLDINSREALEDAILAFDGTVVTVSHDRYFIEKLATRVIELIPANEGGGTYDYTAVHEGRAYTEYSEFRASRGDRGSVAAVEEVAVGSGKEQYLRNKQQAAEARKKENRLRRLKEECEKVENRIGEIDEELFGSAATDYMRAAELENEKNALEERLLEIYEELEG